MKKKENFFILGKILKTFGSKGELLFNLELNDAEECKNLGFVFLKLDGNPIPFFIETFQAKNQTQALVKLADIDTLESAESIVGSQLLLPIEMLPTVKKEHAHLHEVIGYQVVDSTHGSIGEIIDVLEYPSQSLFQVLFNGKEILIPVVDEIVTDVDNSKKIVNVSTPEGLIDLYLES